MGGSRRLPWVIVAVLAMVVTALVVVLLMHDDGAEVAGDATPSPSDTPSASPTATDDVDGAGDGGASDGEPPADDGAAAGAGEVAPRPLWDPGDLPGGGTSDVPAAGEDLIEGDYVAHVTGAFPETMLLEADIQQFYVGEAAVQYLLAHDPTAEIPPPNGFVLVNESTSVRLVPMADDIRIWDWCYDAAGLGFRERSLLEWREAPAGGSQECSAGTALGHGSALYWLQVRDGEVKRVVGQYLP